MKWLHATLARDIHAYSVVYKLAFVAYATASGIHV
jgi:hypothetical protein